MRFQKVRNNMCVISTCLAHGHCTVAILIISRWPPLCQPAFQAMTGHTKTNSAKPRFKLLANTSYMGQRPKRSADTSSQMKVPPPAEDTAGHFTKQNDGGDLPQAKKQVVAKHVAGSPAAKQAGSAPRVVPKEHFPYRHTPRCPGGGNAFLTHLFLCLFSSQID